MLWKVSCTLMTVGCLLGLVADGRAQNGTATSGFGSSSGFGSISAGASGFGNGFQSTNLGGFNSSSFGSGFGSFGSGVGNSGLGGGSAFGGQGFGQGGFGGNQGFVGRDSSDMQAIFSNLGRNANQFLQRLDRTVNRGGNRGRNQNQSSDNVGQPVRVKLNVAFDYDQPAPAVLASNIRQRLDTLLAQEGFTGVDVSVDDRVVTLRGTAPDESRRLVMEKLVATEPGVSQVRNQMTIGQSAAGASAAASDN